MSWTSTDSPEEFRAHAGPFLAVNPAANTTLLTILHNLAAGGDPNVPPRFGWWRQSAQAPVTAAWVQTPPQPLRLSEMAPERATELAQALPAEAWQGLAGVSGARAAAEAFAAAWAERFGVAVEVKERLRLYRLGELAPPQVSGRLRAADQGDYELLVGWWKAFLAETGTTQLGRLEQIVARRTAEGDLLLWEDQGRPVSMAAASPVLAGMSRIGAVYSPPEERGHGYASAVTAGVSTLAIARGAQEVLLFTDLANPVSNSIYQKIGYRPVQDNAVLDFVVRAAVSPSPI
ncbi:GNAT family N-acetyltransferase [Kitasatospora kifunensis]|uniref:Putative GNAT family acetyltransferase n=1 Tax=Kitasatospora kifunensis TaxID=58351 RepID=A0A7W7VVM6_KITKI|nr:GNAT family N-acetyltransferase [Kitasatospora kifunensis]MBB4923849.1 putative GNAT family acetyltransferase [Kitasatospora kifunensis]